MELGPMQKGFDNPGLTDVEDVDKNKLPRQFSPDVSIRVNYASADDAGPIEGTESRNPCHLLGNSFATFWSILGRFIEKHKTVIYYGLLITAAVLYNAYFIGAIVYTTNQNMPISWCDGVGFLIIITCIAYLGLFYFQVLRPYFGKTIYKSLLKPMNRVFHDYVWRYAWIRYGLYTALLGALVTFLVVDSINDQNRLISAFGIVVFILLGWVFSAHPSKVVWRQVIIGVALQFTFGLIILRWDVGKEIFSCIGDKITTFLNYTTAGSGFVYGYLVKGFTVSPDVSIPGVFAFQVLSVIFFFSFFIQILYYYGTMQWLVSKIGWILHVTMGTTAAESVNAAANIFLGQTEAPLVIKPYLQVMTKSELHAVMCGGFATIAGAVLAAYVSFGISASHLLSASVMSAPAALAYAKLFYPESEQSRTTTKDIKLEKGKEANALDAASQGASAAVFMIMNIIANLIGFLAFVAFLNGITSWFGGLVGAPYITFEWIMGKLFIPVAWLMGVDAADCEAVAQLVALKTIVNEFAAYGKLSELIKQGVLSVRSQTIATYALCGFSNPGSIGVQLAVLSTMAPDRKAELAQVVFRAFIAGSVACFMTACIAGTLLDNATMSSVPSNLTAQMPMFNTTQ